MPRKKKNEFTDILKKIMCGEQTTVGIYTAPPWGLHFYNTVYNEEEWKVLSKDIEKGESN